VGILTLTVSDGLDTILIHLRPLVDP